MPISINNILSVKAVLISTSVLSASIMLKATDISVYAPSIYNGVVSWLQPPYLYLLINCIILTIVASSKLQSTSDDDESPSLPTPLSTVPVVQRQPEIIPIDFLTPTTTEYKYEGVENDLGIEELNTRRISSGSEDSNSPSIVINGAESVDDDAMSNKENECVVIAQSVWTAAENINSSKFVKPPASARFSHRRNGKASPEGGRTVLGVSKPKKQDTLENTWKTITEGRAIPMSRHLKKSDTWEREKHNHQEQENTPPPLKTMRKAETFNERSSTNGGSGKVRKEPSLSQDELNRRVEAFIKKFNEDMRLQRQESLNHYTEMVNRGAH